MSKHTPGPWRFSDDGECIIGADDEVVVWELNTNPHDAALIAAAPELAEALEPFAALLQDLHDDLPNSQPIFGIDSVTITAGQLRKARALLDRINP